MGKVTIWLNANRFPYMLNQLNYFIPTKKLRDYIH